MDPIQKMIVAGLVVLLLLVGGCVTFGMTRIEPGHVGILINYAGSYRGVEDIPVVTGWVFYNRFTQRVFEYPTFVQTATWTLEDSTESPGNEEITFNSKEGMVVRADISLSYSLQSECVPEFWVKFRNDDLKIFTHGFLRNIARDVFNEVGGRYGIEEIYGEKKEDFVRKVKATLAERLSASCAIIEENFGFIGAPRIPENVLIKLNEKVEATQRAIKAENELREMEANAKKDKAEAEGKKWKTIQEAEGRKTSVILAAEAERDRLLLEAKARSEANRIINASLTPGVLRWKELEIQLAAVEQWGGQYPQFIAGGNGGANFLMQLPPMGGDQPTPKYGKTLDKR